MCTHFFPSANRASTVEASLSAVKSQAENSPAQWAIVLVLAVLTTSVSLGIATYAGWQRGGLLVERTMIVMLGVVAVLFVHLLPAGWRMLRAPARMCAFAIWCVSVVVVLHGQVTFFMVSHRHAGDVRASTVPAAVVPSGTQLLPGRTRTEIARDTAKVSADLAMANARRCAGACPTLKASRTILAAQLAALDTEMDEAKRREAEGDRRNKEADRNEARRETLRAEPVASSVASLLGTTRSMLELILAVACAVVLEGAAIIGWLLLSGVSGRAVAVPLSGQVRRDHASSHKAVASNRGATAPDRAAVAPVRVATASECSDSSTTSGDDPLLKKIHEAVVTGQLRPTQEAIRKFMRCGQPKAGSLNRQYLARFGGRCGQEGDVRTTDIVMVTVPDA